MAMTICLWSSLGIRLAYKKAARGNRIVWIGAELQARQQGTPRAHLIATAKQEIVDELRATTEEHARCNMVSKKALLSYVGKLNHVAGIVELIRPLICLIFMESFIPLSAAARPRTATGRNSGGMLQIGCLPF